MRKKFEWVNPIGKPRIEPHPAVGFNPKAPGIRTPEPSREPVDLRKMRRELRILQNKNYDKKNR